MQIERHRRTGERGLVLVEVKWIRPEVVQKHQLVPSLPAAWRSHVAIRQRWRWRRRNSTTSEQPAFCNDKHLDSVSAVRKRWLRVCGFATQADGGAHQASMHRFTVRPPAPPHTQTSRPQIETGSVHGGFAFNKVRSVRLCAAQFQCGQAGDRPCCLSSTPIMNVWRHNPRHSVVSAPTQQSPRRSEKMKEKAGKELSRSEQSEKDAG
eukprot:796469-Rhodomonas_salina.2